MDKSLKNTSVLGSPFSPRPRASSSRMSLTRGGLNDSRIGSKTTSVNVVLKSAHYNVERFGLPVPVHVEEIFIFPEKNAVITARVSENGYAWVVSGRRLFVWQYQNIQANGSPKKIPVCHELKLPQSDLAHRAELVAVVPSKTSNHPSCVAVSPEGMVRYWPEITQDHCSVDQRVDLNGQECDSLVEVGTIGCVFVTTTCTLVLVQYKPGNYGHQLFCRTLKAGGSWLGGISKRVSSIFFGPMSSDQGNETKIIRLLSVAGIQQMYSIYILAGLNFQKWILTDSNEHEQLKFTIDLSRLIKEAFQANISLWEVCDHTDIDAWILDIQPDREGILMLCAAMNLHMSPQVYYAMAVIPTKNSDPPAELKDFLLLKISGFYRDNNPGDTLNSRFIICGTNAFIYGPKKIISIKPNEDPDTLEFSNESDYIFSGCNFLTLPIFFSRKHGLVAVTGINSDVNSTLGSSVMLEKSLSEQTLSSGGGNNLTLYYLNPHEIQDAHRDTAGQFKAAFLFHVKNQLSECYDTVNKLFPADALTLPGFNGPLDTEVVKTAKDILDDKPVGDPRWLDGESTKGLGSSHSMLVLHQLMDKQKAYSLYLKFLKESGLWNKLSGINQTNTIYLLGELAEKIIAAIVMKRLPASALFEDALERTVKNYQTPLGTNDLSSQDIFYREVTRVNEGLLWLAKVCEEAAHSSLSPEDVAKTIHEGNQIILNVLNEVVQYRQQNIEMFQLNEISRAMKLEYLPWTAAEAPGGLSDALMLQHSLTSNYGFKVTSQAQLKDALLEDFVMLADFILDGRKAHLASVKADREKVLFKRYCTDRNKLIKPLIDVGAYESAAILAEKYLDFDVLVRICEDNNNNERLDEYMRRFKDTGFPDFVYNWYLKEGKQAKLLERYRKFNGKVPEGQEKLGKFLEDYPTLNWMQQIFDKDFDGAADTLKQLAENESELVTRQKTMLSLSKLAKLAAPSSSDTDEHLTDVNKRLELISYQESLPDYVLQQYGFDANKPRVMQARDLATLFTCPEYMDATEIDFKKALEIAEFVEEETERVALTLQIWRAALLRDNWDFINIDDPLECLQNTLFFKLVDICIAMGKETSNLLPPFDMLLDESSMEKLNENKKFQSLLKAGYEHFQRSQLV